MKCDAAPSGAVRLCLKPFYDLLEQRSAGRR
jgi:hypothetical protein